MRIILGVILYLVFSFSNGYGQNKKDEFCSKRNANIFLMGNNKTKSIQWNFTQNYDPYNGGILTPADASRPEYFLFKKNGKLESYSPDNQRNGNWKLSKDKTQIWIEYPQKNANSEVYTFKIKELTTNKLILTQQGRHGLVEKTYTKQINLP